MEEIVSLHEYLEALEICITSAFVFKQCAPDFDAENRDLKQLKSIFLNNMVRIISSCLLGYKLLLLTFILF